MAESISEGTLKSWSKKEGDVVAADEEIATIETDKVPFHRILSYERSSPCYLNAKIDVSVNAPKAGKIVKILANEEDTVVVGQDLFIIEAGEFECMCISYYHFQAGSYLPHSQRHHRSLLLPQLQSLSPRKRKMPPNLPTNR